MTQPEAPAPQHSRQMLPWITAAVATVIAVVAGAVVVFGGTDQAATRDPGQPTHTPVAADGTATSSPTPDSPSDLQMGQTYTWPDGSSTMTVYRYDHNAKEWGDTFEKGMVYGALDIRFCLKKVPEGLRGISVSGFPWKLKMSDEGVYGATGQYGGAARHPEYPDEQQVKPGQCVRGWLEFMVPAKAKLVQVQYAPEGLPMITWKP